MDKLEHRIASALSATAVSSPELATLIAETETAIVNADQAVEETRKTALDPLQSPNAAEARRVMEDAAFARDRLRTVLPRLRDRLAKVAAQEAYDSWVTKVYEPVKTERDALVIELRSLYAPFALRMADLMLQVEQTDAAIKAANNAKPLCDAAISDGRDLLSVEAEARGAGALNTTLLQRDLRLPNWFPTDGFAWPPNRPVLQLRLSELEETQIRQQQQQVRQRAIAVAEEVARQQAAE